MIIPKKGRAIIIGGGVSGCSVAYHLAKLGWKDVILLERKKLTSGTTWHAAGLIGQLRNSQNMTRLAKYSADLYVNLADETGIETGMRQTGSITVALTESRKEELQRQAALARAFNVEVHEISPKEVKEKYPILYTEDVISGVFLPKDGQADPANIALALAKGARNMGVQILENIKVEDVIIKDDCAKGIHYSLENGEKGIISSDVIVNCAGMWARELGLKSGVNIPLHACEHFYIVTEPIENLKQLPVLRVPDECAYYKEDAGKMMLGAFEPKAKAWGMEGIPDDFCFDQLPEDIEHFEPILSLGLKRMPLLNNVGIRTFFNGPESFTPDNRYYLGEANTCKGYWVAAGYNSIGIISSGGAGMALARWIDNGSPPFDLWEVDLRRAEPFQINRKYLKERVTESLGLLYADHFPYLQPKTSRNIRRSPFHNYLKDLGAVFGEVAGYERANWFSTFNQKPEYQYSWGKQNWFENQKKEHTAVRQNIGIFDMSSFGKIRVDGEGALNFLQEICTAQINIQIGRIVYTQMLNEKGGIESDLTISRLGEKSFLLVVPCATLQRDLSYLNKKNNSNEVMIIDISSSEGVLSIMGPNSRKLLECVSPNNFSNSAHPFGTWKNIEIGSGLARAHRVSYVGELGWEIYISSDQCAHVFEEIWKFQQEMKFNLCGIHALDSCRIEKAYRHFGHDITDEDHIVDAGLSFTADLSKKNFEGKESILTKRKIGSSKKMLQFKLNDPSKMIYHNEPVLRDNKIVGYLTSGNFGHTLGGCIGLGYVDSKNLSNEEILSFDYSIDVAGEIVTAEASLKPMYDPKSERVRM
tara:strand:- start:1383 stop:3827 length:2445 start_codon:yes stop_codon:yes gene_type:complete